MWPVTGMWPAVFFGELMRGTGTIPLPVLSETATVPRNPDDTTRAYNLDRNYVMWVSSTYYTRLGENNEPD